MARQVAKAAPSERGDAGTEGGTPFRTGAAPATPRGSLGNLLKSPSRALTEGERRWYEPRLARDLSGVRIHAGPEADAAARGAGARAFTLGSHVVLRREAPDLTSAAGRELLAHELAHVVQHWEEHGAGEPRTLFRQEEDVGSLPFGRYVDRFERVIYDLDYRSEGGNLSTWLQVIYDDGTVIDINVNDIVGMSQSGEGLVEDLRDASLGDGGRIFPAHMTPQTTPRLWEAKQAAIAEMEAFNLSFMMAAMPAVTFVITVAGLPPLAPATAPARPRVQVRRLTPRARAAPTQPQPAAPKPKPRPGRPSPARPARAPSPGNQAASVEATAARQARQPRPPPMTASQQEMGASLLHEHPGLHSNVAAQAVQGAQRVAGQGVAGGDVILLAAGRREVTVFAGNLTARGFGSRLVAKASQQGVTEIYVQVNSSGASRQAIIDLIQGSGRLRSAFRELEGVFVKVFGPDGSVWWSGLFRGFRG